MNREIEARLGRIVGQSETAREYVEKETADLEWWGIDRKTGLKVKGTKAELLKLVSGD